jgi:sugar phosphate isomerase/epimerase
MQFAINHRKWVDIAHYLGCKAIRTNCRGRSQDEPEKALEWASESFHSLLEYAVPAGIRILIENHGGFSNDPDWMTALFRKVDHPLLGSLPDWREPGPSFDHLSYLKKMLPFAGGMSVRLQPDESQTATMINLCREAGYKGWYGVESDGRHAIKETIRLLRKYLYPV